MAFQRTVNGSTWSNEAGGYVSNGKITSKTPVYSQSTAEKAASTVLGTMPFGYGIQNAYDTYNKTVDDTNKKNWIDSSSGGSSAPQVDPYQSIRDIFAQRREAAKNNINTTYGNQINSYNTQKTGQQQQAQDARGVIDTNYYTKALPEIYAAMEQGGQYRGGQLPGQVIGANTTRTQGLVDVGQTEMTNLSKIEEAIRQAEAEKAAKLTQSDAILTAEEEQAIIDAQKQAQSTAESVAGLTGKYVDPTTGISTPTLVMQQYNTNQANKSKQESIDTLKASSNNYQAKYNQIANDGDPTNDYLLPQIQILRNEKIAEQASAAEKKKQQDFENNLKLQQLQLSQQKSTNNGEKPLLNANDYQSYFEKTFLTREQTGVNLVTGEPTYAANYTLTPQNKTRAAAYLKRLLDNGVDSRLVDGLANLYDITAADL